MGTRKHPIPPSDEDFPNPEPEVEQPNIQEPPPTPKPPAQVPKREPIEIRLSW